MPKALNNCTNCKGPLQPRTSTCDICGEKNDPYDTYMATLRLFMEVSDGLTHNMILSPFGGLSFCGIYQVPKNKGDDVALFIGIAGCSPDDQFNHKVGGSLAFKRASDSSSKGLFAEDVYVVNPLDRDAMRGVLLDTLSSKTERTDDKPELLCDWDRRIAEFVLSTSPLSGVYLAPKSSILEKSPSPFATQAKSFTEYFYKIDKDRAFRVWSNSEYRELLDGLAEEARSSA